MKRIYRQPTPLGRKDIERARAEHDVPIICEAAIALALTEPDRQWMEDQLVELMRDADGSVRSIAALAVGHLARVHGRIDLEEVMPVLRDLLEDSEARGTILERQGDYVVWGPGIDHSWQAEADSVVVAIRWPSL